MKLSFPHMGCLTGYKRLFELLGHEVILPLTPSQRTLDLGVKYSPEFICFPFKAMMGTYIEAAELGAEWIISSGGSGPCRAGLYGEIHQRVLDQLGFHTRVVIFDAPFDDFKGFSDTLRKLLNGRSLLAAASHFPYCMKLIRQMDALEKKLKLNRALEAVPGAFNKAWHEIVALYEGTSTLGDLKKVWAQANALFDAIPLRNESARPLKIGVVGEIYVVMEESTNTALYSRLNSLGVQVESVMYISDWLKHNIMPWPWLNPSKSWRVMSKAKRFSALNCGGHDLENIGWMIDFAERGFDGIVHLMPFGCLPELITSSMIPQMSEQLNIPILSLSLDEQAGTANNQTRLEAFVDLCKAKGDKKASAATASPGKPAATDIGQRERVSTI